MSSLKSFIKAVRKSKTIADERSVVRKESAAIRTSFKDVNLDQTSRRINISKLLYLYIMGEKTHFGQVECIKLLASGKFADKRLGYLATMLLLDENQEVLTLLTNSLDNDMQHPNAYVIGLALCCLGNIASPELARDLYGNVERLMQSNNNYIKKKAYIVASKLIEKDHELSEFFIDKALNLPNEKHAGVVLGCLRLVQVIYLTGDEDYQQKLIKLVPKVISHLKRISSMGYTPDYDVLGINDPFLQVNLVTTLRILATNVNCPEEYLEQINDILTQICSNIEIGKNVGHSILYECIKTIFDIKSDQALNILGINLLGKFLSTKDNNTRYVALNTLLTVINIEPNAVQRHRATIVSCLNDGDISIRRRSLELSFAILNESNIRVLIKEIIKYLKNTNDNDLKPYVISQLILSIEKFSPSDNWKFDSLINILKSSSNFIQIDYISNILGLIIRLNDQTLKKSLLLRLIKLSMEELDSNQFGLALTSIWGMGEYTELILNETVEVHGQTVCITESKIVEFFNSLVYSSVYSSSEVVQLTSYMLTAIVKMSINFTENKSLEGLRLFLQQRTTDSNLEIQIRAVEYLELFVQDIKLRKGLLSKMPAPPVKQRELLTLGDSKNKPQPSQAAQLSRPQVQNDLLLDLMDDGPTPSPPNNNNNSNNGSGDLLSDIFTQPPSQNTQPTKSASQDILDLFGSGPTASPPAPVPKVDSPGIKGNNATTTSAINDPNSTTAFSNENIEIKFLPKSIEAGQAVIDAQIISRTGLAIKEFQLLIAVPKSQKLTLSTNGQSELMSANDVIVQSLKLTGKEGSKIKLRVKANYKLNGQFVENMFDFSNFSKNL